MIGVGMCWSLDKVYIYLVCVMRSELAPYFNQKSHSKLMSKVKSKSEVQSDVQSLPPKVTF